MGTLNIKDSKGCAREDLIRNEDVTKNLKIFLVRENIVFERE